MSSNIPSYEKSGNESSAVEFIRNSITLLSEMKESTDFNLLFKIFQKLSEFYVDQKKYGIVVGKEMLKLNYVSLSSFYLIKFNNMGYFTNDDVWFATYYCLNCLWNYCDTCQDIADEILNTELPNLLITNVLHQPYIDGLSSTNVYYLVKATISIIHNIVRFPGNEAVFRIDELKKTFVKLIKKNDSDFIGIVSMLTLSCLVNEHELHLLDEGENTIKILIVKIRSALESTTKRINGFAIWELVNGLKCVSANDNMKKTIVKENGIILIIDIIKTPSCETDIEKCLGVLWNLCFDENIKATLINDYNIRNIIKTFEKHSSKNIRKCCEGILWLIDNKAKSKQRIKSAHNSKIKAAVEKWKFDLFISYSWANKPTILSIRDELVKSHFKVWIDVDQMKGSTLEAMADGIENSNIFVMGISDAYRTSPNCRTEAEYAFSIKKPIIPLIVELKYKPTSWLGLIMGTKTYYEFSDRRNFGETVSGLISNIKSLIDNVEPIITPISLQTSEMDFTDSNISNTNINESLTSVITWSKQDVEKWLNKSDLGHLKAKFSIFDGKLIVALIKLHSKSSNYLYETLKTEYGMKLIDVLRLEMAFNNLNL